MQQQHRIHLLRLLFSHQETERPLSGQALARALGVSRTAIWKEIGALTEEGFSIQTDKHGYRLLADCPTLHAESIAARLPQSLSPYPVEVLDCVPSTNACLKQRAEAGQGPQILFARAQTAGRGRLGRTFASPADTGVYCSLLLHPAFSAPQALCLTTAAACAMAQAIEECTGQSVGIKWVNDLFLHRRKVCGILTEASIDAESARLRYAVVGVGWNLCPPKEGFPADIATLAGGLYPTQDSVPSTLPNALCVSFLRHFFALYSTLPDPAFLAEYRKRSLVLGKRVHFTDSFGEREGVVEAIDDSARLCLRTEDGAQHLYGAGEIRIDPESLFAEVPSQSEVLL